MTIELNGKTYRPTQHTTIKQDYLIRSYLNQSTLQNKEIASDEVESQIESLIMTAIDNGTLAKIMSVVLVSDTPWNEKDAKAVESAINEVTDLDTKTKIQQLFIEILHAFFLSGVLRLKITPASLKKIVKDQESKRKQEQVEKTLDTLATSQESSTLSPSPTTQKAKKSTKPGRFLHFLKRLFS